MNATALTTKSQHSLAFDGREIKTVTRDGQLWMSGNEIGLALEYACPDSAIKKLYNRVSDEFTPTMTRIIKVMTSGGRQAVRFFSLRGAHLLAMFARTDKAKAFRVWVLNILDKEAGQIKSAPVQSYHFPLTSCKPASKGDCFDNQAQFDLESLTDPRNPAPELDLIKQLERDGHDVTGARVRILALRDQLTYILMANARMGVWRERLESMAQELSDYQRLQGLGALFSREPSGISRLSFAAQLPDYDGMKYGFRKLGGAK